MLVLHSRQYLRRCVKHAAIATKQQPKASPSVRTNRTLSSQASDFQPPPLNVYHGTPVYDNIDINATSGSSTDDDDDAPASARRNADPEAVFVVSGASRGIGLQYCKSLIERTSGKVVACVRDPDNVHASLEELRDAHPSRVDVVPLDVTDQDQVDAAASRIGTDHGGRVDALFNVVGVLGDGGATTPGPERNLAGLDRDWFTKNMELNVIAPMMLSKAVSPMMRSKKGKKVLRPAPTVIVNMSARVGSIADHDRAGLGWHSYRMSKAALNMGTRVMSHELKRQGTWTIALYPGFTDTDLSKPFQKGMKEGMIFPVDFTVGRMLDVVDGMDESHSGGLYDWAGQSLPF